jgi:hypothetical protein
MTVAEAANKIDRALWRAQYACGIIGNVRTKDFALVDLDGGPLSAEIDADYRQRGFETLGVVALGNDGPRTCLLTDEGFDDATISALTVRFLKQYQEALLAKALMRLPKGVVN